MLAKNRWLILISCIIINLSLGAGYAWSVFQGPLIEKFSWTTAQASLAFSISFAMVPIGMIIFGKIQDEKGPKWVTFGGGLMFGFGMILTSFTNSLFMLYLSYGLILGFGIGMAYGCTTSTTVKWFPDKKGLAGGLTAAGFGSGAVLFAPLAKSLISTHGVLLTFRYLGIGLLITICLSSLILSAPEKKATVIAQDDKVNKKSNEMIKTAVFWGLWTAYIFGCVSGLMIIGHAAPIAKEFLNIEKLATLVVMLVALSNTFGRIIWGFVSDKVGRYKAVILMFLTSSIGLVLLRFKIDPKIAILGIMFIALCFGGFLGTFPGITAENWGPLYNGSNYGVMFTAYGIAAVVGPRLAATIKEANNGDYSNAFLISIALNIIGMILILILERRKKSKI
ncbi:MAG: OFA family MFS transporter [Fusobacterium sp.]|uniref:L-lactate MFS transporter n=1 Tax=Fusobacterium sp. TaxID=68766 RepID=UPI0026DD2567|nr:OFA family MFS transporter [Fusobacterium sp.]MDO4690729.1 OFA family MFS transporter [Fusobacterium sp.]